MSVLEFVGSMSNREIVNVCVTAQFKPVAAHVLPPSVLFHTPIEYVSPASPSPVAIYSVLTLLGSMTTSEIPIEARKSVFITVQLTPLFVVFHKPPPGAHA